MSPKKLSSLELASIQNTLLMSTGLDMDLKTMLEHFTQVCLNHLDVKSIHVYCYMCDSEEDVLIEADGEEPEVTIIEDESDLNHIISNPDNSKHYPHLIDGLEKEIISFAAEGTHAERVVKSGKKNFTLFSLNNYGVIIIDSGKEPLNKQIIDIIAPVFDRLSVQCQACHDHKRIKNEVEARLSIEKSLEKQAMTDPLTKLDNRRVLQERLLQEMSRSARHNEYGAVMFIDLDHFKTINDSLGHTVGDKLLIHVADRLTEVARTEDTIFRIGGDEFVVLVTDLGTDEAHAVHAVENVAQRVIQTMSKPVRISGHTLHITPSIGIAIFPEAEARTTDFERKCDDIIKHADTAMYSAKSHGRNSHEFFKPEMQEQARTRLNLEASLRRAVDVMDFYLVYQPLVDCDEKILGVEALIRWHSKELGTVAPLTFIPLAEETGLIFDIGTWVLQTACTTFVEMNASLEHPLEYITVNISPKQFKQPDFVSVINTVIKKTRIDPKQLRLECTEGIILDNIDDTINKMKELNQIGIEFLLDDFGTGYSSLGYLQRLPILTIKIDKAFVTNLSQQSDANRAILDAIIAMADHMCLNCIAEGVETKEDADYCKSKNLHAMQGYYFYRPLSAGDMIDLMSTQNIAKAKIA